jgi:hypothetical protein
MLGLFVIRSGDSTESEVITRATKRLKIDDITGEKKTNDIIDLSGEPPSPVAALTSTSALPNKHSDTDVTASTNTLLKSLHLSRKERNVYNSHDKDGHVTSVANGLFIDADSYNAALYNYRPLK